MTTTQQIQELTTVAYKAMPMVSPTPPTPAPFKVLAKDDSSDPMTIIWIPVVVCGCVVLLATTAFLVYHRRREHHETIADPPATRRFSKSKRNSTQKGLKLIPTNERADFGESTAVFENIDSNMTVYSELNESRTGSRTGSQAFSNIDYRENKYSATVDQVISDAESKETTGAVGTSIVPFSNRNNESGLSNIERLIQVVESNEGLISMRETGGTVEEICTDIESVEHDDIDQEASVNELEMLHASIENDNEALDFASEEHDDIDQEAANEVAIMNASENDNEAENFETEEHDDIVQEAANEVEMLHASIEIDNEAENFASEEHDDIDQESAIEVAIMNASENDNQAANFASEEHDEDDVEEIAGTEEAVEGLNRISATDIRTPTIVSNAISSEGQNEINQESNDESND